MRDNYPFFHFKKVEGAFESLKFPFHIHVVQVITF